MLFPGIKKSSKRLQLHRSRGETFGLHRSYFVRLGDGNYLKYLTINFTSSQGVNFQRIKKLLEECKNEFKYHNLEINGSSIMYEFRELFLPFSINRIEQVLDRTIELLKEDNITYKEFCDECKEFVPTEMYIVGSQGVSLCQKCQYKIKTEWKEKKRIYETEEKHYLKGFFTALIYALPSLLLSAIFYIFLDRLTNITAIMALSLFLWGYRKSGAKDGYFTPFLALITATCYGVLSVYTNIFFAFLKKGMSLTNMLGQMETNQALITAVRGELIWTISMSVLILMPYTFVMIKGSIFPGIKRAPLV